jgi:phosphate/sulfate permease
MPSSSRGAVMNKVVARIKEEILALIPPTLFFLFTLTLVAVIRVLMLKRTGIPLSSAVQIAVGALILGKAVLIADLLPFINRYPGRPLAYNIAWKTAIYTVVAMLIHYLERLFDFWKEAGGFAAANEKLLATMVWSHFWAIQILLVVLILSYCTLHELARVLGPGRMRALFFGPSAPAAL